jgi:hypothetical protein
MHESVSDSQTGEEILALETEDTDLSCDGEAWFHLAGLHCHIKAIKDATSNSAMLQKPLSMR